MGGLAGRVVVITGSTGGLGSAVTRAFAQTEARMALVGRSAERLEGPVREAGLPKERALPLVADVTQEAEVERLVGAVLDHWGRLDVLLNTVGGWSGGKPVWETPVKAWERMIALNLRSAFLLSRAVLPHMLEANWGRIVHVASKTAVAPRAKQAAYAVAKMGLITLTEVIGAEVKGTGVTANVILPSIIDTPTNRKFMPKADPGKWVPPERIAATMRFLCSDAAASINGARIPIYGAV
ncbi:MAG TPA: SDR family oxidoreductase [Anaerolineae bacterium]|nr:SDR family oxidoreductase [Anaerolineae bacterium]